MAKIGKGFNAPVQPSKKLGAIIGHEPLSRGQVSKKLWAYIKKHKLQWEDNGQYIEPDEKLAAVFGSKRFRALGPGSTMMKIVAKNVSPA